MKLRLLLGIIGSIVLCAVLGAQNAHSQNATTPGELVIDPPTINSLGFAWFISGDDNDNCVVELQYRSLASSSWKSGNPLLRV